MARAFIRSPIRGVADLPNRRASDLCKIAPMTAILRKQLPVADPTKRIPSLGVSSSRLGPPSAALFYRVSQLDIALDPQKQRANGVPNHQPMYRAGAR